MTSAANILVVEDEKGMRETLLGILEEEGYRVKGCESAQEALKHLVSDDTVQVVISDLRLPDGSGLQILWTLKKINPGVAFILITGHASLETAMEAINEGAFAYLVKPVDMDELHSTIRKALATRSPSKAATPVDGAAEEIPVDTTRSQSAISTGCSPLDQRLNGGLPIGTFTLMEGTASAGKSVLCQQLAYESLLRGLRVVYFTSQTTVLYPKYAGKSEPRWPGLGQRSWSIRRAWGLRW